MSLIYPKIGVFYPIQVFIQLLGYELLIEPSTLTKDVYIVWHLFLRSCAYRPEPGAQLAHIFWTDAESLFSFGWQCSTWTSRLGSTLRITKIKFRGLRSTFMTMTTLGPDVTTQLYVVVSLLDYLWLNHVVLSYESHPGLYGLGFVLKGGFLAEYTPLPVLQDLLLKRVKVRLVFLLEVVSTWTSELSWQGLVCMQHNYKKK